MDNKKSEDNAVVVIFGEINSSDPEDIKGIKRKLDGFTDYEVSFDYDKNGKIYKATIELIEEEETVSEFDINSFNSKYENFYAGTTNGFSINNMLDDVITNNKTNQNRIIRIIYGSINTTDEDKIRDLKKNFGDVRTNYEVILDYDDI